MRELVYISDAKLRQLLPDLPGGHSRLRDVDAEVKTPLGGFKVGKAAQKPEPGLAAAVAALEASPRAPRWFADPAVHPGNWVHFEAPLSYGRLRQAVVFVDAEEASAEYPSGGHIRLLLHGSGIHVVGARSPESVATHHFATSEWFHFLDLLRRLDAQTKKATTATDQEVWLAKRPSARKIVHFLNKLTELLQPCYTAAWMAGYARVTAVVPSQSGVIVAASPLYVEHIDPPNISVE